MLLNQTDLYAIRAMAFLALQESDELVSSSALSKNTNIPVHYLNKIMRRLVEAELVVSKKGHRGGFQLARPSKDIALLDIFYATKGPNFIEFCVFGWETCDAAHPCPLHNSWANLKRRFLQWAEVTTLAVIQHTSDPIPFKT